MLVAFLLYIIWYSSKYAIIKVHFTEGGIEVVHIFGFKSYHPFSNILTINEHGQGFLGYDVVLMKLNPNKYKKKKISFYCPDSQRPKLDEFFKSKGLIIRAEP